MSKSTFCGLGTLPILADSFGLCVKNRPLITRGIRMLPVGCRLLADSLLNDKWRDPLEETCHISQTNPPELPD